MTASPLFNRRDAQQIHAVTSESVSQNLQKILVDLIELHLQGKHAHWNAVGTNFRDVHLLLDSVVDTAREASDTIAERMRTLDAIPDGRSDTVVVTTTVPAAVAGEHCAAEIVDMIADRIYIVVDTVRSVHDEIDAADPSTADLLYAIIDALKIDALKMDAWMLNVKNRKP